jgi:hypothetical protein
MNFEQLFGPLFLALKSEQVELILQIGDFMTPSALVFGIAMQT